MQLLWKFGQRNMLLSTLRLALDCVCFNCPQCLLKRWKALALLERMRVWLVRLCTQLLLHTVETQQRWCAVWHRDHAEPLMVLQMLPWSSCTLTPFEQTEGLPKCHAGLQNLQKGWMCHMFFLPIKMIYPYHMNLVFNLAQTHTENLSTVSERLCILWKTRVCTGLPKQFQ